MGRVEGRVEGKVALISGGARNIGGASARMLVGEGAKVVIGDLLDEEGAALAEELCEEFGQSAARYVHLDVTQDDDWRAAVDLTVTEFGKLDVLFNNAGIFNGGQLQRYKTDQWQQMLDVNLTGAFLGIRAAADAMIASGGGSIINTSSIEGLRGTPWAHGYVASKWGLRGLTKSVALELRPARHPGQLPAPGPDQHAGHRRDAGRHDPDPARSTRPARRGRVLRRLPRQRRVVLRDRLGVHDGRRHRDRDPDQVLTHGYRTGPSHDQRDSGRPSGTSSTDS